MKKRTEWRKIDVMDEAMPRIRRPTATRGDRAKEYSTPAKRPDSTGEL
jgi:hypothetical protein